MIEKTITLEDIALTDFLGVENRNINVVSGAFPKSRIISRGNEIQIKGEAEEVIRIGDILETLIGHFHNYGNLSEDHVKGYLDKEQADQTSQPHPEGVIVFGTRGNPIRPKTPNQWRLVEAIKKNDLVFALGPAGTGKTYISVAMAVRALKNKEVRKIIITRPAVEAGENLGFLPGDLKEKIDPYLRPIYDALNDMIPFERLRLFMERETIEIAPLAYMRGRTLNDAFILLDEAQNTTPMQMKMFLTRMGPESKMIVTGDGSQIDLPPNQRSGLKEALSYLKDVTGIGIVELGARDVVRHKLVKDIIEAYRLKGILPEKSEAQETGEKESDS
jgi:phosphate starvation-inducible PhoH-like protein